MIYRVRYARRSTVFFFVDEIGIHEVEQEENPEAIEEHQCAAHCSGMPPQDPVEMLVTRLHLGLHQHLRLSVRFNAQGAMIAKAMAETRPKSRSAQSERCNKRRIARAVSITPTPAIVAP